MPEACFVVIHREGFYLISLDSEWKCLFYLFQCLWCVRNLYVLYKGQLNSRKVKERVCVLFKNSTGGKCCTHEYYLTPPNCHKREESYAGKVQSLITSSALLSSSGTHQIKGQPPVFTNPLDYVDRVFTGYGRSAPNTCSGVLPPVSWLES